MSRLNDDRLEARLANSACSQPPNKLASMPTPKRAQCGRNARSMAAGSFGTLHSMTTHPSPSTTQTCVIPRYIQACIEVHAALLAWFRIDYSATPGSQVMSFERCRDDCVIDTPSAPALDDFGWYLEPTCTRQTSGVRS